LLWGSRNFITDRVRTGKPDEDENVANSQHDKLGLDFLYSGEVQKEKDELGCSTASNDSKESKDSKEEFVNNKYTGYNAIAKVSTENDKSHASAYSANKSDNYDTAGRGTARRILEVGIHCSCLAGRGNRMSTCLGHTPRTIAPCKY
jgi:hypothetical protein